MKAEDEWRYIFLLGQGFDVNKIGLIAVLAP